MSKDEYSQDIRPSDDLAAVEKNDGGALESTVSCAQGEVHDARNGEFKRTFTQRQIHIIALGSNVGSGIFIGIGKALADGGPGNMILAYLMVCVLVWAVLQTLSEMTIIFPTSGNFIDYADRWVDPALAFGAGFAEWLGWTAIVAAEAIFFSVLVDLWADGAVPLAALLTMFLVATFIIFLLPNSYFAWFEYVTSVIKIFLFLLIIVSGIAVLCGAGPKGYIHSGVNYTELGAFKNGFGGFARCALLACWAVGDQVFIGILAGETKSPRMSMGHATKLVPYRVIGMYMTSVILATFLVRSDNSRLLGGSGASGAAASPFVIGLRDVGIAGIPDILNAGMILGVLAISAEAVYLSSRILRTMAHQKLIPEFMAKVDSKGRPRWALAITVATSILLTYLALSGGGNEALNWFLNITSSSFFCNWLIIGFTSFRFRASIKAQQDPVFSAPFAWKSSKYPLAPAFLLAGSTVLLISCIYAGVKPLGGGGFTAENFFSYMLGFLIIFGFTLIYKIGMRTKWRSPSTADLTTGRRNLSEEEILELESYYKLSSWQRFKTYVQLW
ncbi:hypothetical protein BU24DRAFT_369562 [Aaosphaeria arxii CBS 175.79]|uniref:Amino acid permease/ SLC12A domain-containing protein n=1 Tax=Aaosphaeria arxii CBS 175.79 TaxID=1450172 RepID=A0A6A5XR65_9PLEO|nr:uncharacterized protein BU24DRAFT_369562 [Aaosphaeria arxii CBS 175.79]KAF2015672.1 hypothetical protein BU24DRAFT_369562 [Aaosphaeria arxii CBS 175.79]